ncbi:hypothetical protein ACMHYB_60450 [Sorangium sp. So ce1128]
MSALRPDGLHEIHEPARPAIHWEALDQERARVGALRDAGEVVAVLERVIEQDRRCLFRTAPVAQCGEDVVNPREMA